LRVFEFRGDAGPIAAGRSLRRSDRPAAPCCRDCAIEYV